MTLRRPSLDRAPAVGPRTDGAPILRQRHVVGFGETDDAGGMLIDATLDFIGSPRVGRSPLNIPCNRSQRHGSTLFACNADQRVGLPGGHPQESQTKLSGLAAEEPLQRQRELQCEGS